MADLSPPSERNLIHNRSISLTGYARDDGLWDIEAHMVDTRTQSVTYPRFGASRQAGQPLHEMKIRVTIDDDMLIHDAAAVTIHAPFDVCSIPPKLFPKLKGLSLKEGWRKRVSGIIGGTGGCTHLFGLIANVAAVAYQTVSSSEEYVEELERDESRPFFINTCHAYNESGPVIEKLYPNYFKPRGREQ